MADQANEGCLSPYLRRKRIEAAFPYLKGRVLDFGCGTGALAAVIDIENYFGVEIDEASILQAKEQFPTHKFSHYLPNNEDKFDTVVSLAVIEHVDDQINFLITLSKFLNNGHIVITTPHPSVSWVHGIGAAIGLFSKHANKEHGELLDQTQLSAFGSKAGLHLKWYSRFLYGANQLAVYSKGAV
jgi:2-polyprenyl-3-methyl-5-hydroxy-6-metoxy-1,4-benzoquinol methylase